MTDSMNENSLLFSVLAFGYAIAPLFSNRFFLKNSKTYFGLHLISYFLLILAIFFGMPQLNIVWIFFCGFGLILFYKTHRTILLQNYTWIGLFPFGFSLLSSVWFFCGTNQCYLLGYTETWSYYAAIHGCFIGWLFLSGIAHLSQNDKESIAYPILSLCIVILFLLIAFGIHGNPILKKIGVIGYSLLFPSSLLYSKRSFKKQNSSFKLLIECSLFFLCFSLLLALLNEFYIGFPKSFDGWPIMVILHGIINAIVVIPCFLGSLLFEEKTQNPIRHKF
ncbi:hypothetical protein EHS15_03225 [Leptospira idonii]|uniref:Uncharacterized protein n=1 Tax=Leptospira idonii TaxID=1193500 RepID=A0A4V3JYK8_9LEPT|nr:hypothetical protein EHS15_03225 [Leptospira idonii]